MSAYLNRLTYYRFLLQFHGDFVAIRAWRLRCQHNALKEFDDKSMAIRAWRLRCQHKDALKEFDAL